jgi:phosphoenolpyruvate carboxykinase (GTP)
MGAALRSEATSAAEHTGKVIMNDPFAMRPFFGYNFGRYLQHWLNMPKMYPHAKMPKIYQVNWFRKGPDGKFIWPGFGENLRALDWVMRRIEGDDSIATKTAIGNIPTPTGLNTNGLDKFDYDSLFSVPKDFWLDEVKYMKKYFDEQVGKYLPKEVANQLEQLGKRVEQS